MGDISDADHDVDDFIRKAWGPYSYVVEKVGSGLNAYNARNMTNGEVSFGPTTAQLATQNAIDDLSTGFGGDVNRPKGAVFIRNNNFYLSLDLTLKSGVWLLGEGEGTWLSGKITVPNQADQCGIEKIKLEQTAADHCLYLNGAGHFTARDSTFYLNNTTLTKFAVLIDGGTLGGYNNDFDRCKILSKGHGLKQTPSASSHYTNSTDFRHCYFLYNAGGGQATGGQIGMIVDGDGVEKNFRAEHCYMELWDTAVDLDEGFCTLDQMWLDNVNTAGVNVSQAAVNQANMYLDLRTVNVTGTKPILILGGRKYYVPATNNSIVYDSRSLHPEFAWIQKYITKNRHDVFMNYGLCMGHGAAGQGMFVNATATGASSANSGNYSEGNWHRYTGNATDLGPAGIRYTGAAFTHRGWNPTYFAKFRVFDKANTRGWFMLSSLSTVPTGDDWINAASGFGIGWKSGDANFQEVHNDGTGVSIYTDTGIPFASNTVYTLELRFEDTTPRVGYSINDAAMVFQTAELPAQQTALFPHFQIEQAGAATARLLDRFLWYVKPKNT
jgi:hypothetical protein